MKTNSLWMLAASAVLVGACSSPPESADFNDSPVDSKADGFFFQRGLSPVTITTDGQTITRKYDPSEYASFMFDGSVGQAIDVLSWKSMTISTVLSDFSGHTDVGMAHALFVYTGPRGNGQPAAKEYSDSNNWSLVREHGGRQDTFCLTCFAPYQRTQMLVPESGRYLLLLLTNADEYRKRGEYNVRISQHAADETKPGNLVVKVSYAAGRPVAGLRVALGDTALTTDDDGRVFFGDLLPNTYSLKFGSNGYYHTDVVVGSGEHRTQNIVLSVPIQ